MPVLRLDARRVAGCERIAAGRRRVDVVLVGSAIAGRGAESSSWIAIAVLVLLVAGITGLFFVARSRSSDDSLPLGTSSPTAAATLAPSQPTQGDYQFLDLAWGSSREAVQSNLKARSFNRLERDEDGDERSKDASTGATQAVYAMFAGDKLSKVMVLMLAPDSGGVYELAKQSVAAAYRPARAPAGRRGDLARTERLTRVGDAGCLGPPDESELRIGWMAGRVEAPPREVTASKKNQDVPRTTVALRSSLPQPTLPADRGPRRLHGDVVHQLPIPEPLKRQPDTAAATPRAARAGSRAAPQAISATKVRKRTASV